eukprot:TRINITY_DN4629_c0_g1_i4.p1 TRINITY_DN4629_c0_g1~~TRINITY_DN4629_c0_g1_i4.p1  ORF type:complete len:231 (+),score=34.44 TRINITY_DN4629_c0_g1_i4:138-830(+)
MSGYALDRDNALRHKHFDNAVNSIDLPNEIIVSILIFLPTPVIVHRVGLVCKQWHSIVEDDHLWQLRCGLAEIPPPFHSWFAYAQRQTMREQALDHLYGRAGLTQNWRKGLQLLSVLVDAGDDYAMALYSWALSLGIGIRMNRARGEQLLQQSNHVNARAGCALYVEQDFEEAYRLLSTECDASDPHVQCLLECAIVMVLVAKRTKHKRCYITSALEITSRRCPTLPICY